MRIDDETGDVTLGDSVDMALSRMSADPIIVIFLEAIAVGIGKYNAGAAIGWSPAEVNRKMKDPSFRALHDGAEAMMLDGVEHSVIKRAIGGNLAAAQFVLTNRRPDRWADRKAMEVTHNVGVNEADKESIKAGIIETLRDKDSGAASLTGLRQKAIDARSSSSTDE